MSKSFWNFPNSGEFIKDDPEKLESSKCHRIRRKPCEGVPLASIDLKICIHTTNLTKSCAKKLQLEDKHELELNFQYEMHCFWIEFCRKCLQSSQLLFSTCISSNPYLNIFNDQSSWMKVTSKESPATENIFIRPMAGLCMALTSSVIAVK